jgi:hypothetical protein
MSVHLVTILPSMLARLSRALRPASLWRDVVSNPSFFRPLQPAALQAASFSSTPWQNRANVVILNKVPRGTTLDMLKSALPFSIVDLVATGEPSGVTCYRQRLLSHCFSF